MTANRIETCCQYHSSKKKKKEGTPPRYIDEVLPTRVIGVGVSEGSITSLISSTKVRGTFSALSHVWGEKILTTLKIKELQEWGNEIDMHTHPRSFQNAVTFTKLGLQYP
jgi:hypothetical protein